ncbi:MAG: hypothetical protein ACYSU0_17355 [Planctomycetota bacterium]|jgi:hypothetical protein
MGFWIFLWKAVLILGVGVFAGMAVWVTIAGWRDIRSLFAAIDKAHGENGPDEPS